MSQRCVVALGANLGDRLAALRAAVSELAQTPGLRVLACSPVVETPSVGGPADSPDYLNAVVELATDLDPWGVLGACQRIEADHGRTRDVRWGPRTLDLDVVWYQDYVSDDPQLTVPHPRAHERAFVLVPWAALDAHASLHGRPVADWAREAADCDAVRATGCTLVPPPGEEHASCDT